MDRFRRCRTNRHLPRQLHAAVFSRLQIGLHRGTVTFTSAAGGFRRSAFAHLLKQRNSWLRNSRRPSKQAAVEHAREFLRVVGQGECELRQLYNAGSVYTVAIMVKGRMLHILLSRNRPGASNIVDEFAS